MLLLLSHFCDVRLRVTPQMAARQAPPSLGFSRKEHWSGLPFPSPVHESEKWKWSCSVMSDSSQPHGLQTTRLLRPWDFPGKSTGVGCHCLLCFDCVDHYKLWKIMKEMGIPNHFTCLPGGSDDKASACNMGDPGLIHGSGRFPGEENGIKKMESR